MIIQITTWILSILSLVLSAAALYSSYSGSNSIVPPNSYRHREILDSRGKYLLEWEVDWAHKRVTFNVTVQTRGFVGFGLSRRGKMSGADIVIGGVHSDGGYPYFSDRHAIGHVIPQMDSSQDWSLHSVWERGNWTFLSFSRAFETCDPDYDLPISDDLIRIIWCYGEKDDDLQYHFENRGSFDAYLLDPDIRPDFIKNGRSQPIVSNVRDIGKTQIYNIDRKFKVPEKATTYWCTFHKAPTKSKRHIIGFNPIFPTELDRIHTHHFLIFRCIAPQGIIPSEMFDPLTRDGGSECYFQVEPDSIGAKYCREVIYIFAVGGRATFFPEHVGVPMTEDGIEYFLMQTHYDNPAIVPNLRISSRLEIHYTSELRPHDAGIWWVGTPPPAGTNIFIPPNSLAHVIVGHCAEGCTSHIFPPEGIRVFAALTHTHTTGKGMRVLHFRGNTELPWIIHDDNYDFNYQQWRILKEERVVLPGDQLSIRCVYDTTPRNGSVVSGGYATTQEMCDTPLYYYNRIHGYSNCRSQLREKSYFDFLGVNNFTWDFDRKELLISSPLKFAGLTMVEYGNKYMNWDINVRDQLQRHHMTQPHVTMCPSNLPEVEYNVKVDEQPAALPRGIRRYKQVSNNQCSTYDTDYHNHHNHHDHPHNHQYHRSRG